MNQRIRAICRLINKTDILIDIGTDHAYVPIECIRKGLCRRALASDINGGPLRKAAENIEGENLRGLVETVQSDGLSNIEIPKDSVIVMAGLGSDSMIRILDDARERIKKNVTFVLQPASRAESLKKYLLENSFSIMAESFFIYNKRPYMIIKCGLGPDKVNIEYDEDPRLFVPSEYEAEEKDALKEYIKRVLNRQKKILEGYDATEDGRTGKQARLVRYLEAYYESI